ncbi:unnamed protein product [Lactuca saligna]|uniref:Retrotransposon gag domain-containing protein n=1 Tax=Lactuca saligna TaxID=75948 RepID=A0AA36EKF1_LACSI|nr:unnamed protein product [Lactuca saligna]
MLQVAIRAILNISHADEDDNLGGTGEDQDNCTLEMPPFIFQTPPTGRQPRVQPARSDHNTTSAAIIADLQEQLETREAELKRHDRAMERMQQLMQAASLLTPEDEEVENEDPQEVIDESRSVTLLKLDGEALHLWEALDFVFPEATLDAMTWEAFNHSLQERFCLVGKMRNIKWEFLSLEKRTLSVAKYNLVYSDMLQFKENYCPTEAKQVEHYVEGLPPEYRANERQRKTLAAAMDEAIQIEVDMATPGHAFTKRREKKKCEGLSKSSQTMKGYHEKNGDMSGLYMRCPSSHKGSCNVSTMI